MAFGCVVCSSDMKPEQLKTRPQNEVQFFPTGGDNVHNFEPKKWLKFKDLDKSITELRAIYKVHPEWFETPKPKSDKGKNVLDYSIK